MVALLVAYAVAVAAASYWVGRGLRGPEDFLSGRRELSVKQGIGLFGGIFLGATAVGVVGQGYQRGIAGAALDLALGLGFAILALTLLERMRGKGQASLAALFRAEYGQLCGAIAALVAGSAWIILLSAFVAAAGIALGQLTGWSQGPCVAAAVVILLLYSMPGGMRAVTATNLAHLAILAVLIAVLLVLATGHRQTTIVPASHTTTSWGYLIGVVLLSAPTTIVAPDVMMGVGTLRSLAAARRTLAIVVLLLAGGGLLLAVLGTRASHLVTVGDPDLALPRMMHLLLPSALERLGLLVLFGAALTGAVAEVMVCTFILDEELGARRRLRGRPDPSLALVRLQMVCIAAIAGGIALADTHVVGLVLTAFRVFVPGIVPQAVFSLTGLRTRAGAVAASMLAGPLVCLAAARIAPGLLQTPADPVLWGTIAALGIMATGRIPPSSVPLTEP